MSRWPPQEERFWSRVDRAGPCWLWQGKLTPKGYARTRWNGRERLVHVVAYEQLVGPVAEGLELDHLCRVRHCVNPSHLEPVTHAENVRRGHDARGPRCGHEFDTVRPGGHRACQRCLRESWRRHARKRRASASAR